MIKPYSANMQIFSFLILFFPMLSVTSGAFNSKQLLYEKIQFQVKFIGRTLSKCPGYPDSITVRPIIGKRATDYIDYKIKLAHETLKFLRSEYLKCDTAKKYSNETEHIKKVLMHQFKFQLNYTERKIEECIKDHLPSLVLQNEDAEFDIDVELLLAESTLEFLVEKLHECHKDTCVGFHATFTTLNTTGRYGPKVLGDHYTGQDHEHLVSIVQGIQQFTVPCNGTYRVTVAGAAAGYGRIDPIDLRGRGAVTIGEFQLVKGSILKLLVGQVGGYNSGNQGVGGGGGTYVTLDNSQPLVVAGGGGGSDGSNKRSPRYWRSDGTTTTQGNPGSDGSDKPTGGAGGQNGQGGKRSSDNYSGGGGGLIGNGQDRSSYGKGGLSFINGGTGGQGRYNNADGGFGGGGGAYGSGGGGAGGGGYSGGGASLAQGGAFAGGGGSYNKGHKQNNTSGANNSEGFVIIEKL